MKMRILFICLIIVYCAVYTTSLKLSPCAKWNTMGVTIAGANAQNQIRGTVVTPEGIFIDRARNALYISDGGFNGHVQLLSLNQSSTETTFVATDLISPNKLYVDEDTNGPTIYISLSYLNEVQKWIPGATHGIRIGDSFSWCAGISVDRDKNVYVAEGIQNRVSKWSPQTNQTTVIAGKEDSAQSASDNLNGPAGIYLSQSNGDLYIADEFNHRIQKWPRGASEGITVAGSSNGTEGSNNASLNNPNAVWIDEETNVIYIVDSFNHRIQRYQPGATEGDTIAGQLNNGNGSDQLNLPNDLAFDDKGNLYVSDKNNNRMQMFQLIDNQPCSPISTANSSINQSIQLLLAVLLILSWITMLI